MKRFLLLLIFAFSIYPGMILGGRIEKIICELGFLSNNICNPYNDIGFIVYSFIGCSVVFGILFYLKSKFDK